MIQNRRMTARLVFPSPPRAGVRKCPKVSDSTTEDSPGRHGKHERFFTFSRFHVSRASTRVKREDVKREGTDLRVLRVSAVNHLVAGRASSRAIFVSVDQKFFPLPCRVGNTRYFAGAVFVPLLLLGLAVVSAGVVAYGTNAFWAQFPHGIEVILWSRRLEWPLVTLCLLLCLGVLGLVISG